MRIEKLRFKNYHGFEEREFSFQERFTVLVGENGTGKTAVLEGISSALSLYIHELSGLPTKSLDAHDIRLKKIIHGEISTLEPQFPSIVECEAVLSTWAYEQAFHRAQVIRNHTGVFDQT